MLISIDIPGFSQREIVVRTSGLFSGPKLLIDGVEASSVGRNEYSVRRDDDRPATFKLQGVSVDPVPRLLVDGDTYLLAEPLRWFEWALVYLPIGLVGLGGLIGGFLGGLAMVVNARLFRTELPAVIRFLLALLMVVGAYAAWPLVAGLVLSARGVRYQE